METDTTPSPMLEYIGNKAPCGRRENCSVPGQCGICLFTFKRHEMVVAGASRPSRCEARVERLTSQDINGCRTLPFKAGEKYVHSFDPGPQASKLRRRLASHIIGVSWHRRSTYYPVGSRHSTGHWHPGYHEICLTLLGNRLPTEAFRLATRHMYHASSSSERARFDRTQRMMPAILQKVFPDAHLPVEIWQMIATDEFPLLCAATQAWALWHSRGRASCDVDPSKGVWATYILIDGVRYVQSLANTPPDSSSPPRASSFVWDQMLLAPGEDRRRSAVYTMEDHVGLRQVVFADPRQQRHQSLPTIEDVDQACAPNTCWWRTLQLHPQDVIAAESDGRKIRAVRLASGRATATEEMMWAAPMRPLDLAKMELIPLCSKDAWLQIDPRYSRMHSIPIDAPDVIGYSIGVDRCRIQTMHTHHRGEEDFGFYQLPAVDWIYYPMGPGEHIQTACTRGQGNGMPQVFFLTNQNRSMRVCNHNISRPTRWSYEFQWTVCGSDGAGAGPSRLYYGVSQDTTAMLGVAGSGGSDSVPDSASLSSRAEAPLTCDLPCSWPAAAELSNVSRIAICRETHRRDGMATCTYIGTREMPQSGPLPVAGILLEYGDGTPPCCLGFYRLDQAEQPIDVGHSTSMHLLYWTPNHSSRGSQAFPVLVDLEISSEREKREARPGFQWLTVHWSGRLELWSDSEASGPVYTKGDGSIVRLLPGDSGQ